MTPEVIASLIGGLFAVVGYFGIRTLSKIDKNQTVLFEQVTSLWKELFILKGEHNARHNMEGV